MDGFGEKGCLMKDRRGRNTLGDWVGDLCPVRVDRMAAAVSVMAVMYLTLHVTRALGQIYDNKLLLSIMRTCRPQQYDYDVSLTAKLFCLLKSESRVETLNEAVSDPHNVCWRVHARPAALKPNLLMIQSLTERVKVLRETHSAVTPRLRQNVQVTML